MPPGFGIEEQVGAGKPRQLPRGADSNHYLLYSSDGIPVGLQAGPLRTRDVSHARYGTARVWPTNHALPSLKGNSPSAGRNPHPGRQQPGALPGFLIFDSFEPLLEVLLRGRGELRCLRDRLEGLHLKCGCRLDRGRRFRIDLGGTSLVTLRDLEVFRVRVALTRRS